MNELEYFDGTDNPASHGFRNIGVTQGSPPYIKAWWPPGHSIGWEHTCIHQIKELLEGIGKKAGDVR